MRMRLDTRDARNSVTTRREPIAPAGSSLFASRPDGRESIRNHSQLRLPPYIYIVSNAKSPAPLIEPRPAPKELTPQRELTSETPDGTRFILSWQVWTCGKSKNLETESSLFESRC